MGTLRSNANVYGKLIVILAVRAQLLNYLEGGFLAVFLFMMQGRGRRLVLLSI